MITVTYSLMCGDTRLGLLERYKSDFPWIYCHFVADPTFTAIQPLFEESYQQLHTPEDRTPEGRWNPAPWRKIYEKIAALDLYVMNAYGGKGEPSIIHIHEGKAQFRRMCRWSPIENIEIDKKEKEKEYAK